MFNNSNTSYSNMSEEDSNTLNALTFQALGFFLMIFAAYILLISTLESIKKIQKKYDTSDTTPAADPDIPGVNGAELLLLSQSFISFAAYSDYYNKLNVKQTKDPSYDILPEYLFNISGFFAFIGDVLTVVAAQSLYTKNHNAGIFEE